ncbi:unnamed protein product [Gordionus sp. m RMFG-2023]
MLNSLTLYINIACKRSMEINKAFLAESNIKQTIHIITTTMTGSEINNYNDQLFILSLKILNDIVQIQIIRKYLQNCEEFSHLIDVTYYSLTKNSQRGKIVYNILFVWYNMLYKKELYNSNEDCQISAMTKKYLYPKLCADAKNENVLVDNVKKNIELHNLSCISMDDLDDFEGFNGNKIDTSHPNNHQKESSSNSNSDQNTISMLIFDCFLKNTFYNTIHQENESLLNIDQAIKNSETTKEQENYSKILHFYELNQENEHLFGTSLTYECNDKFTLFLFFKLFFKDIIQEYNNRDSINKDIIKHFISHVLSRIPKFLEYSHCVLCRLLSSSDSDINEAALKYLLFRIIFVCEILIEAIKLDLSNDIDEPENPYDGISKYLSKLFLTLLQHRIPPFPKGCPDQTDKTPYNIKLIDENLSKTMDQSALYLFYAYINLPSSATRRSDDKICYEKLDRGSTMKWMYNILVDILLSMRDPPDFKDANRRLMISSVFEIALRFIVYGKPRGDSDKTSNFIIGDYTNIHDFTKDLLSNVGMVSAKTCCNQCGNTSIQDIKSRNRYADKELVDKCDIVLTDIENFLYNIKEKNHDLNMNDVIDIYENAKICFKLKSSNQMELLNNQSALIQGYQKTLNSHQTSLIEHETEIRKYRDMIKQIEGEKISQASEIESSKKNCDELAQKFNEENGRNKKLSANLEGIRESLNMEINKKETIRKNLESFKIEYDTLNEMHQVLLKHYDNAKVQQEKMRQHICQLEEHNSEFNKDLKEKEVRLKESNRMIEGLTTCKEANEKDISKLHLIVEQLRRDIDAVDANRKNLLNDKIALESVCKRQEVALAEKDEANKKLTKELQLYTDITSKISHLTMDLKQRR